MAKSTRAELEKRVNTVYQLIMAETPRTEIDEFCLEEWGVCVRQVTRYIKLAQKMIETRAAEVQTQSLQKTLAFRAYLKHRALKTGDNGLALKIEIDTTKLLNLYPPPPLTKMEVKIDGEIALDQLTVGQLKHIANTGELPDDC